MKNIFSILFISLFFVNCNSQEGENTISTIELKALLNKEKIQFVDIRTPREIDKGFIKGALFVDFFDNNFTQKIIKKLDKNKPVYLYCRSGNRSGKAAKILQEKGFKAYNVLGGYNQWKKEN